MLILVFLCSVSVLWVSLIKTQLIIYLSLPFVYPCSLKVNASQTSAFKRIIQVSFLCLLVSLHITFLRLVFASISFPLLYSNHAETLVHINVSETSDSKRIIQVSFLCLLVSLHIAFLRFLFAFSCFPLLYSNHAETSDFPRLMILQFVKQYRLVSSSSSCSNISLF